MEPARLDSRGYGGTYKFIGGRLSLDLVNTVSWPDESRRHDWLDDYDNLISWADQAGVLDAAEAARLRSMGRTDPHRAARVLAQTHRVRELLGRIFSAVARGDQPSSEAVDDLNSRLREPPLWRRLAGAPLRWEWAPIEEPEQMITPVVYDAADLLVSGDPGRLGFCPACDWLFYDTTRNRSRRWCDMANCGSREKARSYYRRSAATPDEPDEWVSWAQAMRRRR